MTSVTRAALLLCMVVWTAVWAQAQTGLIHLMVDGRDAPRRLIHVQLSLPVVAGPLTLLYPQWIPGEHAPSGPIADVVALKMSARGETLVWKRDSGNLFAFQLTVPAGASTLEVNFDFISPASGGSFSSGRSMTSELAVFSWNQVVLYPQGSSPEQLRYQAKLRLPKEWKYGTALAVAKEAGGEIEFEPVPLATLIDSPVSAGAHYRTIELGVFNGAAHFMHLAADSDRALEMPEETVRQFQRLIRESGAMFGARHYRSYHFLLTLSDHVASFGLEHHESSDDRLAERTLIDEALRQYHGDLLPHEFVHSWNGKYRRPTGLATQDYSAPMKGELLWVYEGLTEYLGDVLAARSGLISASHFRDYYASLAAHAAHETGRNWRSLADVSVSGQLLYAARDDYSSLRRGTDFYGEGALVWLEVDMILRQRSGGKKSLDDFCRAFYAGTGGAPVVRAYTLADLIAVLQSVQSHDWVNFFRQRVDAVGAGAPLGGIENGGWKLVYDDQRSEFWSASEDEEKSSDLLFSLGLYVNNEGAIRDVTMGGPAQKAGLAPGGRITSVNGRQFTATVLREVIQAAVNHNEPTEFIVKDGEHSSTFKVDYHGGEKYPHLVRDGAKVDLLKAMMAPIAP